MTRRTTDLIDIVVPLHNNFSDAHQLLRHLESASNETRCRIIVVDDASTEIPPITPPRVGGSIVDVRLIRNDVNRGFAGAVNLALRDGRNDAILLNTDTLVFDGWVDRLRAAADGDASAATVTPLSNAATILSYPTFPDEYRAELEVDWKSLDQICAQIGAPPVEIPTGIGFCMLIRRACLDTLGPLDEVAFRHGYGEECDFCRRAAAAGWRNLAAPNVFVWHRGEGSFKAKAVELRGRAQDTLRDRYPDYHRLVADFIRRDPLRDARRAIDLRRIARDARPRRLHLHDASRGTGGGSQDAFLQRHGRRWPTHRSIAIEGFAPLPNLPPISLLSRAAEIRGLLTAAGIDEVVRYHTGRFSPLFARVTRVARRAGLRTSAAGVGSPLHDWS